MREFHEIQKFNQWWLKILMMLVLAIILVSIYKSISEIKNDGIQIIILLIAALITLLFVVFMLVYLKLETKINEQGIYFKFWPFQLNYKILEWHAIKNCYVKKYNPITDYGGWGYLEFTPFKNKGKAYNVKGNIGIQIEFHSGKNILIGTQKKEEAEKIINTYHYKFKNINLS